MRSPSKVASVLDSAAPLTPCAGIRTITVSILAAGLLAGSAVGVAAQVQAACVALELGEPAGSRPTDSGFAIIGIELTASDPRAEGLRCSAALPRRPVA